MHQRGKHRGHPAEMDQRNADTDGDRRKDHQRILHDAHPSDGADPTRKHEGHQQHDGDCHRRHLSNRVEARDGDDNSNPRDLQLQVRNEANDAHNAYECSQVFALVAFTEEVGLGLHPVSSAHLPDLRKNEERHDVRECQIGEDVQGRTAARVGPATCSQKRKGRVDLTSHEQKNEYRAETAISDGPLFEVHLAMHARQKTDGRTDCDNRGHHRQANCRRAHGRACLWRAVSTLYAAHMHSVLSTIQAVSQNKLNGRPKSMGSMRSQSGTEKHIAANGISAKSKASTEGFFTAALHASARRSRSLRFYTDPRISIGLLDAALLCFEESAIVRAWRANLPCPYQSPRAPIRVPAQSANGHESCDIRR